MRISRIKKLFIWSTISLVATVGLVAAGSKNSDASERKAALAKAGAMEQQRPIKLRYYGGPKYPRYPE